MANRTINNKDEPSTAPESDRWYDLALGPSLKDSHSSTKFCTLRYEFKPASIDKNQPGSLHKNKENRVTVEFHNNQPGKPKVTFEGSSEDYKENDAVLFFDGETFRLERLHRAVKRLRHVRLPGESAAAAATTAATTSIAPPVESYSPPIGKGAKLHSFNKSIAHPVPVEVERIDIGNSESLGTKSKNGKVTDYPPFRPNPSTTSPNPKDYELEEHLDIFNDDDNDIFQTAQKGNVAEREFPTSIDINLPNQNDIDDEIANIDVSDDEADKGPNAAEALRAQADEAGREDKTTSSSGSSGSESSGTGSGSGSGTGSGSGSGTGSGTGSGSGRRSSGSDSETSDADSVNSI